MALPTMGRGATAAAARLALSLLLLAACASAVYEDQAGRFDWLRQHVGRVSLATLAARPRPRLVVASEAGVVAALSTKDGSLLWRKVLDEQLGPPTHLEVAGSRVAVLADEGRLLQAYDLESGRLLWSWPLFGAGERASLLGASQPSMTVLDGTSKLVVALGNTLQVIALDRGRQLSVRVLAEGAAGGATRLYSEAQRVWAATLLPSGTEVAVAALSPSDGSTAQQARLQSPVALSAASLTVSSAAVAALSADGEQLCTGPATGGGQLACQPLARLLPGGASAAGAALLQGGAPAHLTLQTASGAALVRLEGGAASVTHYAAGATATAPALPATGDVVAGLATPGADGVHLALVSATDGGALEQGTVAQLQPRRVDGSLVGVDRLFLGAFKRAGGEAFRLLVVLANDNLALAPPAPAAAPAWVRHEALAAVADSLFVDLPASTPEIEAQWLASQPSLAQSMQVQALILKAQMRLATPEEAAAVEAHRARTSDRLRPTRDPDGFRKQIVVLTRGGVVAALHNGDGRLLWTLDFGGGGPRAAPPRRLAPWRVPHRVGEDIQVVAFGPAAAHVINAHTGSLVASLPLPGGPGAEVLPLPAPVHDDSSDQHAFVVVPPGGAAPAALLPDTPATRAAYEAARPRVAFWRVDASGGRVVGLGLSPAGAPEERWSVAAAPPGSGQAILAVAAQPAGEAVNSYARVTGTGALKFKLLDPNKLLVAAGAPQGQPAARPALSVLLLDAVTGRVLASQRHEFSSIEVFDASPHDLRVSELAFRDTNFTASSWDAVRTDSYFTKLPAAVMGLTRTARGVTAKQILLGSVAGARGGSGAGVVERGPACMRCPLFGVLTQPHSSPCHLSSPAGQVYMLDRRLLDPARPRLAPGQKGLSPEQAAEGLPPHAPDLPLTGQAFATLDKRVARLHGVATEPAVLESTSLMFAYGLDHFYTRLLPSRQFDMVPDDFPYALLVLVVAGLSVACLVLRRLSGGRALKRLWQ
eukprot:scaffold3.g6353.t1